MATISLFFSILKIFKILFIYRVFSPLDSLFDSKNLLVNLFFLYRLIPQILYPSIANLPAPHSKFPMCAVKITTPFPFFNAPSRYLKPFISTLCLNLSLERMEYFRKSAKFLPQFTKILVVILRVSLSSRPRSRTLETFFFAASIFLPDTLQSQTQN